MLTGRRGGRPWRAALSDPAAADPFVILGLEAGADLTDDEVRAAWRRIAAATHPDRADGGDPGRFARAAAAYTELRTGYGRGEARADLREAVAGMAGRNDGLDGVRLAAGSPPPAHPAAGIATALAGLAARVRGGRPVRLGFRVIASAAVAAIALLAAGPGPAGPALVAGAATWLVLTVHRDLRPPG